MTRISPSTFAKKLLQMGEVYIRDLPWKQTKNPYHIWISEIILQQTRVAQGWDYYLRFIKTFPDILSLADAHQDQVIKAWEGLGYYTRARNIHAAAQQIINDYKGVFPTEIADIRSLKGIGPYTSAAIASFAFDQAYASIDGNAHRLFARVLGIFDVVGSKQFDNELTSFAQKAIEISMSPAKFNQAIMDIGAQICTPAKPKCSDCAFAEHCVALTQDKIHLLPIKKAKAPVKHRFFHYFFAVYKGKVVIDQRVEEDIWQGLYQLPLIETESVELNHSAEIFSQPIDTSSLPIWQSSQILSHQKIHARFYAIELDHPPKINKHQSLVERQKVLNFAFPKVINSFFENKTELLISKR